MTHSEVQIRRATDTDLAAIVELNSGLFREDAGQRDPSMNLEWPKSHGMLEIFEVMNRYDDSSNKSPEQIYIAA